MRVFSIISMDNVYYLSPEGLEKLQQERQYLKTVKSRELSERIDQAKQMGDLKENAEYHAAKDEMGMLQARLREIEEMLKNYQIIEESSKTTEVRIGSQVKVSSRLGEKVYRIVGMTEADPSQGLISNESPLGRAFLGKAEGDDVAVQTPGGITTYTILEIK